MEEQAGFYFLAASSGRTSYSPTSQAAAINATPVDAQLQLPYMLFLLENFFAIPMKGRSESDHTTLGTCLTPPINEQPLKVTHR